MKFSEEYKYKNITLKKFNRIPLTSCGESFSLNDGNNSIIKVQDKKLLHSWTLEYPHQFTSAVEYCHEEDSFYCIIDNNTLLKWSSDEETLKNGSKFLLQEPVFNLLPVKKHKPIVMFSSGKVLLTELLYVSLEPIGESIISEDEELVWSESISIPSEIKILCLTLPKDTTTYRLHSFSIRKKIATDYSSHLIENSSCKLKNWCLDQYNSALLTIWSNGDVLRYPLHSCSPSPLLKHSSIEEFHELVISVINADHIALAITDIGKKETRIEFWDVKFASLKASKVLKNSDAVCNHIVSLNTSLFLQLNESLVEIPFNINKSTLAAALGKSTEITSQTEYCWKASTAEVQEVLSSKREEEVMAVDEITNETEILAKRILEEGSAFKTNNRESDLYELLRFTLRNKYKKKETGPIEPNSLFSAIFTSNFRESTLVQYIKKLNILETVALLETLLDFLENKISVSTCDLPSDAQLFDWVFIIMKSHTEALLLSKDKKKTKVLKRLDTCLLEKFEVYEDYVNVENMFHLIKKKDNILPVKQAVGKYFVETIDI